LTPLPSNLCIDVYKGDTAVIDLIDDPLAWCLDTTSLTAAQSYTLGQPGFDPNLFVFNVATCSSMLGSWYQNTHISPPLATFTADCATDLVDQIQITPPTTNIKILVKQFNSEAYTAGQNTVEAMDWYLLSDQTQGWLNNTSIVQNMFFDRVDTMVGDSSFLNSDFFSFSSRTPLNYIQPSTSNVEFSMYNYDIYATKPIGGHPNQVQY